MSESTTDKRSELIRLLNEVPSSGAFESLNIADRVAELASDLLQHAEEERAAPSKEPEAASRP